MACLNVCRAAEACCRLETASFWSAASRLAGQAGGAAVVLNGRCLVEELREHIHLRAQCPDSEFVLEVELSHPAVAHHRRY